MTQFTTLDGQLCYIRWPKNYYLTMFPLRVGLCMRGMIRDLPNLFYMKIHLHIYVEQVGQIWTDGNLTGGANLDTISN